jgi:hypothetical protein
MLWHAAAQSAALCYSRHNMSVRFRQTARRLQVSLIAGHREGTKGRSEHIAGLGSIPLDWSTADRIAFWIRLHQRLDTLGNGSMPPGAARSSLQSMPASRC